MRRHVIISGTGRAGTTFLVHLLSELGLDTGFRASNLPIDEHSHAGLEQDIQNPKAPYIVKSPWLSVTLPPLLAAGEVGIDHAIIPIRNFEAAAQSRVRNQEFAQQRGDKKIRGGLWMTECPEEQRGILDRQFSNLMECLAQHDVPITLMSYPRLVRDPEYLFRKLGFIMPNIEFDEFDSTFRQIVRPDWIRE